MLYVSYRDTFQCMFWQHRTNIMQKGGTSAWGEEEKKSTQQCEVYNKGLNKYCSLKAYEKVKVQLHTLSPLALDRGQC